jgi:hypothetical protein
LPVVPEATVLIDAIERCVAAGIDDDDDDDETLSAVELVGDPAMPPGQLGLHPAQ